jgi:hypothetical protein
MNHAYGLYSKLPPNFSNGVMDPYAESRICTNDLRPAFRTQVSIFKKNAQRGEFVGTLDANPGILNLAPRIHLDPGKRYDLAFEFNRLPYVGILQIVGKSFSREYVLPRSGEPLAFGAAEGCSHSLPLWTSRPDGETVQLRFIPTMEGIRISEYSNFAKFALSERIPASDTVRTLSLLPYRAEVYLTTAATIVLPRMYLPGYNARLNGAPVAISVCGDTLAAINIPAGKSFIEVDYRGPLSVRLAYFITGISWCFVPFAFLKIWLRQRRAVT